MIVSQISDTNFSMVGLSTLKGISIYIIIKTICFLLQEYHSSIRLYNIYEKLVYIYINIDNSATVTKLHSDKPNRIVAKIYIYIS